jgi:hypothetical protein
MAEPRIRQLLFEMTAADGTELGFTILEDQRCAMVRNGEVLEVRGGDEASLGRAVKDYFRMIERCGGSRHPFQAVDEISSHPHAG